MVLAISSSYGIEINKNTENNIAESITQQMNSITLNNAQSSINNGDTNNATNTQTYGNQPPTAQLFSTQLSNIQTNGNNTSDNLFDIKKLITTKHFIKMNDDEKDWARLDAYDRLSKASQEFWQTIIAEKNITDITKAKLYCSSGYKLCVLVGIDPLNVIFDELKFNINSSCLVDTNLYVSSTQLSALKAQINQCTEIIKRYWQGIIFVMRRLNTDNADYATNIYFRWKHLNSSKIQNNSCKKKP